MKRQFLYGVLLLALAVGISAVFARRNRQSVTEAAYPEFIENPSYEEYVDPETGECDEAAYDQAVDIWWEFSQERREKLSRLDLDMEPFLTDSAREFLADSGGENRIYSPLNIYMALGMLAETTDGESRAQILRLLGEESIEALREDAGALWNIHYYNGEKAASILAGSLWLRDDWTYTPETLANLAEHYYASSYQGEMGSPEFTRALQAWLNDQTGGLLAEQAGAIALEPGTAIALATTVYYRARWQDLFAPEDTNRQIFHTPEGGQDCEFMNQTLYSSSYYWQDQFGAVELLFAETEESIWFLLPDEGVRPEDLLENGQAMGFLLSGFEEKYKQSKDVEINLSMPRFDISSSFDLVNGLEALGVTDVFDRAAADFSPLCGNADGIYVSSIPHAVGVKADEEGIAAVAFAVIMADGGGGPLDDEIDFVLDRPFLFAIMGNDNLPMFVGVVNNPAAGN